MWLGSRGFLYAFCPMKHAGMNTHGRVDRTTWKRNNLLKAMQMPTVRAFNHEEGISTRVHKHRRQNGKNTESILFKRSPLITTTNSSNLPLQFPRSTTSLAYWRLFLFACSCCYQSQAFDDKRQNTAKQNKHESPAVFSCITPCMVCPMQWIKWHDVHAGR